jgi:hypothetical protein
LLAATEVDLELAPDGVADATLQSAQRLLLRLPLGDLALVVGATRCVVADLGDRGQVEGVVQLAVTSRVEPMAFAGTAGRFDGAVPLQEANRSGVGNRVSGDITSTG